MVLNKVKITSNDNELVYLYIYFRLYLDKNVLNYMKKLSKKIKKIKNLNFHYRNPKKQMNFLNNKLKV